MYAVLFEIRRGRVDSATERIAYADGRMIKAGEFVLPEQDNIHVANRGEDPDMFLKAFGAPIQALRWSQWEYLRARIALERTIEPDVKPALRD